MIRTIHFPRFLFVVRRLIPAVALCACTAAAQDINQVQSQINALQKTVADELSGVEEFKKAETDLLELFKQIKTSREPAAGSKEAKVFDSIGELLVKVRARVPDPYPGGSGQQTALPVPQFAEQKLIGQIAHQLRKSQVDLITEFRENSDSQRSRDLLVAVVLGQEDLAWEAGWPFTADEIKAYREAGGLTKEIYLSRRNRGVQQINEDLKADFEAVGRESSREFSIFSPPQHEDASKVTKILTEKRGEASASWREGTKPFDEDLQKMLFQR